MKTFKEYSTLTEAKYYFAEVDEDIEVYINPISATIRRLLTQYNYGEARVLR